MLTISQIKKLPVITKSGKRLGRVSEASVDTESQSIIQYQVKPHRLLSLDLPLLIHRSQVISITAERILVEDNVVSICARKEKSVIMTPVAPLVATTTLRRS